MKKTTITLMMFLASMLSLANPIGKQKARVYAQDFFNSSGREIVGEAQKAPGKLAASQDQPLYVFNAADNRGFVIIAGDDCIDPLLGYTETGSYNEDDMPDNFKFWMEMMVNAINALPSTVAEGQADKALRQVAIHNAIQPLIKTKWDQGSATASGYIYNTLTPTINSKHCLTGCVATAGAQVMYYYQHPKKATKPVPGYESNSTLGMLKDLPSIQFDWSQMKNTYSKSDKGTSSERAVSELMLYCGYAAYMDYGLYGSGANEYWMVQNMVELFDYDPYTWKYVTPSDYGVSEWDAMIYGELSSKRPVIFSGWGVSGAHAFLCDGYDGAGLYHFNWGWGGSNNGYFKLIEPNPFKGSMDNGYSMDVYATIGLQPNTGKTPPAESLVATTVDTWVDGTKISTWLTNDNPVSACFGLGIGELKANGTINVLDTSYEYNKNYELKPMYWRGTFSFDVSSYGLSKGKHNLVFICIEKNAKQWVRCRPYMLYFEVTVKSDGSIEIIRHPLLSLEATSIDVKGNLFATVIQPVIVKVKSKVDDYTGPLYLFANTSNTRYNPSYYTTVAIEGGNTGEVELFFKPQTAGTYNLWVCTDEYGENVIGTKKVVIKPVPSYETKLTKLSMTVDCQPNTTATLQVKNETQYDYFDSFRANLYIYHDGDYSLLTKKDIYPILIKPGETKDIIETFGGLEPGTNYYIEFYYKPKVGKGFSSLGGKKFTIINPNQEVMELVDLGLSVKWCNMNVGASAPAYYGNYYAWGETATKSTYTWANYKHASGTANSVMSIGGNIAATTYDPAYRSNKNYCLPTKAQIDELLSKCTFKETIKNGMTGYIVTGPSGKSIFLPLGGYKADGKYNGTGEQAYFWAADVDASNAQKANALFLKTDGTKMTTVAQRRTGICIRAVEYKASTPATETMELVDLGLSVKWCNMNLGATVSSGYGNYYAWGETTTKSNYTWANYKHASGTAASVKSIGNNIAATTYDAAYKTNKTYCLPTKAQINELLSKCTFKEGTKDGVKGYTVTGPSGKSIFLPLGGYKADGQYNGTAEQAYYWAADVDASNAQKANALFLKTATASKATVAQRRTGVCIRAVEYKASTPATETMELVDLGLSVKWCNMNLGASASSGYGNYYAWGETATKANYTWANYKHASGTAASVKSIGNNIAATTYDAAYQTNKTYCLPTKAQINELLSKCTFKEGTKDGVKGYTVTGPSGKSIFLPLGGYKADGQYNGTAEQAYYWAADVDASNAQKANALFLKTATASKAAVAQRRTGANIRAVEYKASTPTTETMELVDLGLSVKWCNMNLGASASSSYGNYYAWGETATKTNYTWANYKHASGTAASVKSIGNNIAATTYDAAYQSNKTYCLPTKAQIGELLSKCTFKESTKNGVNGYTVTGPSGKSIFLPLGGYKADGQYNGTAEQAYYWAADVDASNAQKANALFLKTATASKATVAQRRTGANIRAVEYKTSTPATEDDKEYVDLGLTSGTLWATCNIGASSPEQSGAYFAWGETSTKSTFNWTTYSLCSGTSSTVKDIGYDIAGTSYDAATKAWGSAWVMPSLVQMKELIDECTLSLATLNGVKGFRFTGPSGKSIFFPMSGYKVDATLYKSGEQAYLWSCRKDLVTHVDYKAGSLYMQRTSTSGSVKTTPSQRRTGNAIRPVRANGGKANSTAFESDTNGILAIPVTTHTDDAIYNLQGLKIEGELQPGVYIRGGKKFVVK